MGRPDAVALIERADELRRIPQEDPRSSRARNAEAKALLEARLAGGSVNPARLRAAIATALGDSAASPSDRFTISALAKELSLREGPARTRQELVAARASHANQLVEEFPTVAEGYGYMLSIATGNGPDIARPLLDRIANAPAPESFKQKAARVKARLDLQGTSFTLSVPGVDLQRVPNRPVVVYSWSIRQPMMLSLVKQLSATEGVGFIGVNIDPDPEPARKAVALMGIPGAQIYDGAGLDGPVAQQLSLTMDSSIMLVDAQGVVADTAAHIGTEEKLRQMLAAKGGQR